MNWSYIAGYFDGEGHVGLHPQRKKSGELSQGMITTLTWYNSHLESLEAMRAFMGVGYIRPGNGGGYAGSQKPVYVLSISRKTHLLMAIDGMLPDLLVKRDAVLALRQHLVENVNEKRAENFGLLLAIPKEDYYRWYVEEGQSLAEIARHVHATPSGVLRLLRLYDIPRRERGGAHAKGTTHSPETIAKMKATRQRLWADPEYAERMRGQLILGHQGKRSRGWKKPTIQGEQHPRSKLSDAQTIEIRQRHASGWSQATLARTYGVSDRTIHNIVHGLIRTHVGLPSAPPEPESTQLTLIGD